MLIISIRFQDITHTKDTKWIFTNNHDLEREKRHFEYNFEKKKKNMI